MTIHAWQGARRELGVDPYRFEESERRYRTAREAVTGHVMALFAYTVVPRASGASGPTVPSALSASVLDWVRRVRCLNAPDDFLQRPVDVPEALSLVVSNSKRIAPTISTELAASSALLEPLVQLAGSPPSELSSIRLKDEPDKAATIYETIDDATRVAQASAAVADVLKVAVALADKLGETIATDVELARPLTVLLSDGPWANRVSVLAAVRYGLEQSVPRTASRMKDRQAFRDFDDWRSLWQKFPDLGDIPQAGIPESAPKKFALLQGQWTEMEFVADAKKGPAGEVFRHLEKAVNLGLDLSHLARQARENVEPADPTKKHRRVSTEPRARADEAHTRMLGATGEAFVFQQLRSVLPDFDLTHWVSKAREVFGFSDGNDDLGYDFDYYDSSGILTGQGGARRCLIEVKSNAKEARSAFEMSMNEWETAVGCHNGEQEAVYVIIRVQAVQSNPTIVDVLVDPVQMHNDGLLDYSSRDLLVAVGKTGRLV